MTRVVIRSNEPLKPLTTFKIGGPAKFLALAATPGDFREALQFAREHSLAIFVLGGGSNILVSDRGFDGLVIHAAQMGLSAEAAAPGVTRFRIAAGETWDGVVRRAVGLELWGIENLSHIPGQAGAALVQNIGAYGQQISDVFESAEVMEIETGSTRTLGPDACGLGYRRSIFNTTHRNKYIILSLVLRLRGQDKPNLEYPDVKAWFGERRIAHPSLGDIREAIIQIRDRKFPFPREEKGGNAGSFFKNLQLSEEEFQVLRSNVRRNFPAPDLDRLDGIRKRAAGANRIKVPTAFLIEICGLKGRRAGGAKVNETQPLVLLNQGGARAADVLTLAARIRRTIRAQTGMVIELEPELVGFEAAEIENYLRLDP